MAFRPDMRLSEGELIQEQINNFGFYKKCLRCPLFDRCNLPQYNAPGMTYFYCRDFKGGNNE